MLLSALKPTVRQIIKGRISQNNKNAAELWTAVETEYKTHAADTQLELVGKFLNISMDNYNKDVQACISDLRNICGKLKVMKFEIPSRMKNDTLSMVYGITKHHFYR